MGIQDSFIWYQKKIGTYDKQKWETTIEQTIFSGLTHIPMRNTKPNTDLIDLDLVRGSSFTKAKPQHGFITVVKQATFRCVLLPFFSKWWIQQTSKAVFYLFLFLYVTLIVNTFIYSEILLKSGATCDNCEVVPYTELIIPSFMLWLLTIVLSQIVSTKAGLDPPKATAKLKHYRRKRSVIKRSNTKVSFADTKISSNSSNLSVNLSCCENNLDTIKEGSKPPFLVEPSESKIEAKNECICEKKVSPSPVVKKIQEGDDGFESLCGNGSRTSEEEAPECSVCKKCDEWVQRVHEAKIDTSENRSNPEYSSDRESERETEIETKLQKRRICKFPDSGSVFDSEEDYAYVAQVNCGADWTGVTTNSEECSYSSDIDDVSDTSRLKTMCDYDYTPSAILNRRSAKVSCTVWEGKEIKKADLSMLDISSTIIGKVETVQETMDYFYAGICVSIILAFLPLIRHLLEYLAGVTISMDVIALANMRYSPLDLAASCLMFVKDSFGVTFWEQIFTLISSIQRCILAACFFFLLSVAEKTFKQRLLYAKFFCHLTSFRRAQKWQLPHFRLNKVRNIKTWLSVRSYLKKRGPQRSVDVIVTTTFIIMLMLMSFLCIELLKDTLSLNSQCNIEALTWSFGLGIFLLRFLTLGTKINKKYRNLSVLLTEQINLHLQIEQKPHKKEELTVANNVLKLAIDLLKELESPFKIIGLSANPILSNITKVVILSALSGVLSDMLGFKLKLHKIKIK